MDFSLQSGNQISLKRDEKQSVLSFMTRKTSGELDIVNIALMGIALVFIIVSIGLFFYNLSLASAVNAKKQILSEEQNKIKNLKSEEIGLLFKKLKYANEITRNYNTIDTSFFLLGRSTEDETIYNTFSLAMDTKDGGFNLTLTGETASYKSLIQQRNTFLYGERTKYFSNFKVESFGLDEKRGKVSFKFSTKIKFAGLTTAESKELESYGDRNSYSKQDSVAPQQATSTP